MTQWLYRATPTKVDFDETARLAVEEGFICRSAFEADGSHADNTKHIDFRDLIHFYFTSDKGPRIIGTFEVVGPNRHPHGKRFGKGVKGTTLLEVDDDDLARVLASIKSGREGYDPDPVLKRFTGWAVVRRSDVETPPFDPAAFPNQATLVRVK